MDEAETWDTDLTTNGEGSANLDPNGEIEPQTNNSRDVFDGSLRKQLFEREDGSTGQDHVEEDGPMAKDHVQEYGPKDHGHGQEDNPMGQQLDRSNSRIGDIDTTTPFESVKEAVSMFSEIVDWKAHKIQIAERRKRVAQELRKAHEEIPLLKKMSEAAEESKQQALSELDNAKRRLEEQKLNLERAQTEESQEKQDAELTKLRVEEMEQGIADESSVAVKAQLEVAQARHHAAVSELKAVKLELENLQKDYTLLVSDRDLAIQKAEEAVSNSEETEKNVEDLTIKLITTKEALESAHGAYLEEEEHRVGVAVAREQDGLNLEEELKQSEEEWEEISQQMAETEDLNSKLDTASVLLENLKAELASYMGEGHVDMQSAVDLAKIDLKEVKLDIEKVTDEVNSLKVYAKSLNSELEQEKATLFAMKQNQGSEELILASLEAELMGTISEVAVIEMKEKEAQLVKATEEADEAKSRAQKAREELRIAKKAVNQAKKGETAMISKLNTAVRAVEGARASERLALGAISAVEESESARSDESEPESKITISVEKYYELSRKAKKAEDEANDRVSEAISQIDLAKESEVNALKKLEQVKVDLASKKEQLATTMQKAEKAKKGKLVVEQELRIRRSERRKAKEDGDRRKAERKKKKRSLIPRFFLFLCTKKGRHSNKNNTNM